MNSDESIPVKLEATPPEWCIQSPKAPGRLFGCSASEEFDGCECADEAWGDTASEPNSGLTALAYLWRRFGPPVFGSDDLKDLCRYQIGTPSPEIFLSVHLSGSSLRYAVGYLATDAIRRTLRKANEESFGRICDWAQSNGYRDLTALYMDKDGIRYAVEAIGPCPALRDGRPLDAMEGPVGDLNRAILAAMRELLRPVCIRDVPINILGCVGDDWGSAELAPRSKYAGYGVPIEAMDKLIEKEKYERAIDHRVDKF